MVNLVQQKNNDVTSNNKDHDFIIIIIRNDDSNVVNVVIDAHHQQFFSAMARKFIFFDVETSSLGPEAEIVQIGAAGSKRLPPLDGHSPSSMKHKPCLYNSFIFLNDIFI